jgi:hypothetical protein
MVFEHDANKSAPTWVVYLSERLVITEDGSAPVTDPTTISLVEFDEVPLLSTWRFPSTPSTMTRRSLLSVRPCIDAYTCDDSVDRVAFHESFGLIGQGKFCFVIMLRTTTTSRGR